MTATVDAPPCRPIRYPPTTWTRSATRCSRTRCRCTRRCATPARSCTCTTYDVYAMARYEQVHAALVDWQSFQSAAGVGCSNFQKEKPWRPPSLLLEADPPRHDAPRRVLGKILSPRSLRKLRDGWLADGDALVDEVLSEGPEFDGVPALAEAFPLRVFPDAVGIGRTAGRT